MMGLEALYFGENERQEMDYRLRMRMAKVLGLLSFDPISVKNAVKEAYDIRSIFSHGGLMDEKRKNSCEKKFPGGVSPLTKFMLDLLRVSLIVTIISKMKKSDFIELLDNSMVSEKDNQIFFEVMSPVIEILGKTR
jgi:hypothetical protein